MYKPITNFGKPPERQHSSAREMTLQQ